MKYTIVLPGLFMVGLVAGSLPSTSIVSIPPTPQVGPSNAQFTASTQKFDSPLLGSVNSTSWEGSGVSWAGEGDGNKYVVTFDSPGLGVTGSLTLEAVSLVMSGTQVFAEVDTI
jgi:hypothetical protein